jgi:eukaryotic-like serine/threonine-protein kinase
MAEVYLAVAEGLSGFEKRVVIKRLLPQHAGNAELLAMFLDEARLCAALHHPHIAEVYDVGQEDGDYFFAMEHVAGRDLGDLLAAAGGAPLPLPEALAIGKAVAEGLHHAHEQRDGDGRLMEIVHRDVSPSNVLVGVAGDIKLIDFGVAKWAAQRTETRHGVLKGKCAYMSPEQCRAEPLDRRSDLFSLGVLLYEITTGRRPFEGANDFEVMTAVVRGLPEPPSRGSPHYPPALEALILRALSPHRQDRPPTALALAEELGALATAHRLTSSPAAIARLLEAAFGPALQTGEHARGSGDGATAPIDEPRPPPVARTATDHVAAAAQLRPRPRIALVAVLLAATLASAMLLLASRTRPHPASPAAIVPAAPSIATPPAPGATTAVSLPGATTTPLPPPTAHPPPPAPLHSPPTARPRRRAPPAPTVSPAPAPPPAATPPVKVWDPDSPIPP